MIKTLLIGNGQAGNKAVMTAIENGVVKVDDTVLVNSTSLDFPANYTGKTIIMSSKNIGCGKERGVSKSYAKDAIKKGLFNLDNINNYNTVIIVGSVEGGTASGSTPLLAQYFTQVCIKNVHIFAICGFEEDVRGLENTIGFFKEIDGNTIVHTISNKAFLQAAGNNKIKAEELANEEFCKQYSVIIGDNLIPSSQNIDDTDIIKLANAHGYTIVEKRYLEKSLIDSEDYNKMIKKMIYESKSIKSENPAASKIGVILNINDQSKEAIGDYFEVLKQAYGFAFECFKHIQYDGGKEYIAFIASGMKLPVDEMKAIYDRYIEQSSMVNKDSDEFFDEMAGMELDDENKKFNMIRPEKSGISVDDFLKKF